MRNFPNILSTQINSANRSFQSIIDEFAIVGREVEIKKKDKKSFGKVESAFLKDNTDVYDVCVFPDR